MNDGFQFIDIIFFAMVAAFLVLRLRSVLGRRTGNERPPESFGRKPGGEDNVIPLPERRGPAAEIPPNSPLAGGIDRIHAVDNSFTAESFLGGARAAFGMIVGAFAAGDRDTLRPLLADTVFANFTAAIDAREQAGERLDTEVVTMKKVEIVEADMEEHMAVVTVKFVTDQVNVVRDAEGRILEGDPNKVTEVTDLWTFARNTASDDPNWELMATRSTED